MIDIPIRVQHLSTCYQVCSWPVYHFLHTEPVDFDQDSPIPRPMQPGRKPFDANQAISTILLEQSSRRFHELYHRSLSDIAFVTRRRRASRYAAAGPEKPEAYSLEYVEDFSRPRTT